MRNKLVLVSFMALAACGGGGPTTVGGNAPPPGAGGNNNNPSTHSFVNPTEVKTYSAIGGVHSYNYSTDDRGGNVQYNQLYAGDASTARNSGTTVTYNPRDAIFDVDIVANLANVNRDDLRFQDPAHRTNFGGLAEPQDGVPDLTAENFRYLETGSSTGGYGTAGYNAQAQTFFYQVPGTTTDYVTLAGFVRNALSIVEQTDSNANNYLRWDFTRERAAFVYGERTQNSAVPTTGTATYTGDMLATMVYNPLIDTQFDAPTYFQWISGTASATMNFGASTFTTTFNGTVAAPHLDQYSSGAHDMPAGSTFTASGSGQIDLVNKGGFWGQISSMSFTRPDTTTQAYNSAPAGSEKLIAGSSVDGAFFGPAAEEVGGGFRIVGGTPDERIDIQGAFTGAKP